MGANESIVPRKLFYAEVSYLVTANFASKTEAFSATAELVLNGEEC